MLLAWVVLGISAVSDCVVVLIFTEGCNMLPLEVILSLMVDSVSATLVLLPLANSAFCSDAVDLP